MATTESTSSVRNSLQPHLTPQFCFNTTALRDFLRLSRAQIDDSIHTHLNSLLSPSRSSPFQPGSTSVAQGFDRATNRSRQNVTPETCKEFKKRVLFPSWQGREDVLIYCTKVAEAPLESQNIPVPMPTVPTLSKDHSMPQTALEATLLQAPLPTLSPNEDSQSTQSPKISRNYWGNEQVVDPRTDPYSARDYSYTRESEVQILKDVLMNETSIERIIKSRSWNVLNERCIGGMNAPGSWEDEWRRWQQTRTR